MRLRSSTPLGRTTSSARSTASTAGRGRHRHEEERVGAERQQQQRGHEADDRDRGQTDVNTAESACTIGPDAGELLDRVRGEADPADCDRLEHVGGLRQVAATQDLARDEVPGEVGDGEREHAPCAEAVPVDGEERHRRGDDEEEAEVDGDDGTEAEQARRSPEPPAPCSASSSQRWWISSASCPCAASRRSNSPGVRSRCEGLSVPGR